MLVDGLRVLVVDDDPDTAEMTSIVVAGMGCEVRTATSFRAAMSCARTLHPNVAIVDHHIGARTGSSLVDELRASSGTTLYVIAFTGSVALDYRRAGYDVHVSKPSSPRLLREAVKLAATYVGAVDGQR